MSLKEGVNIELNKLLDIFKNPLKSTENCFYLEQTEITWEFVKGKWKTKERIVVVFLKIIYEFPTLWNEICICVSYDIPYKRPGETRGLDVHRGFHTVERTSTCVPCTAANGPFLSN